MCHFRYEIYGEMNAHRARIAYHKVTPDGFKPLLALENYLHQCGLEKSRSVFGPYPDVISHESQARIRHWPKARQRKEINSRKKAQKTQKKTILKRSGPIYAQPASMR